MISPLCLHWIIAQAVVTVGGIILFYLMHVAKEEYYQYVVLLNGLAGLAVTGPALYFYRRDEARRIAGGLIGGLPDRRLSGVLPGRRLLGLRAGRRLSVGEGALLLVIGAALSSYVNVLVAMLRMLVDSEKYWEEMDKITTGQNTLALFFWMGIVAPLAEEMIFRWLVYLRLRDCMHIVGAAVLSGAIFGIYHGNLIQAIYATIMGAAFAYFMEITGSLASCVLLHMGANLWSTIVNEFRDLFMSDGGMLVYQFITLFFLTGMLYGSVYFYKKYGKRKQRMI